MLELFAVRRVRRDERGEKERKRENREKKHVWKSHRQCDENDVKLVAVRVFSYIIKVEIIIHGEKVKKR